VTVVVLLQTILVMNVMIVLAFQMVVAGQVIVVVLMQTILVMTVMIVMAFQMVMLN
jgi:hypothetical protein